LARQLSAQLAARGVALVDAPVTGGVRGAQKGKLSSMVSGPADAIAIVRPVIDAYSSRIILFGDQPGAAQTVKLINNVLSNANLALALEALAFGAKAGIDVRDTLDLVNSGTGQNFATSVLIPEHVLPRSFASGGALAIVLKDMNILLDEADALGAPMPLARATLNLFRATEADFGPAGDWTLIGQHIEQQAGIILRSVDKS
jgi:3-hydroxyisobutyrate dehydrogenase-like beta-hydroxyacid dehydrogenase